MPASIQLHSVEPDLLNGYVVRVQTPNYDDSAQPRRSISAGTFNARLGAESTVGIMLTVSDADDLRAIAEVLIEAAAIADGAAYDLADGWDEVQ